MARIERGKNGTMPPMMPAATTNATAAVLADTARKITTRSGRPA
jgi:hypothetical protein